MRDEIIKNKISVFISSKCGDRYSIVRKALKELLQESNLVSAYVFEDADASTQMVEDSYMREIETADLCVFLVDNEDGVTTPVYKEQKKARLLKKKSIYFFCDEEQKEKTSMQNELMNNYLEKYQEVHEFSDFISKGYKAIINEVITIYKEYCRGSLIPFRDLPEATTDISIANLNEDIVSKESLKGFDETKNVLYNTIFAQKREIKNSSPIDKVFRDLMNIFVAKDSSTTFDFDSYADEICKIHPSSWSVFIHHRTNAIKLFYQENIADCICELTEAYTEANLDTSIPNWLAMDVLIDWRFIERIQDTKNNIIFRKSRPQELLEENGESLYYPVLDRLDKDFRESVLEICLNNKIDTPYTNRIGGVDSILDVISNSFIIAAQYGSLVQMLMVCDRIIEAYSQLCFVYRDHGIYFELIRELIIDQNDTKLKEIIRAYNQSTDLVDSNEIQLLIQSVDYLPISYKKGISKLMLFNHFGYYMAHEQYSICLADVLKSLEEWFMDDAKLVNLGDYYFSAVENNIYRIENEKIVSIILEIFKYDLSRWYVAALEILCSIDLSSMNYAEIDKITSLIIEVVNDEKKRNICHNLSNAILHVRLNTQINSIEIDQCVNENMSKSFLESYSLETKDAKVDSLLHINRYIDIIKFRNENQGKNGMYSGYADNPYKIIVNIIKRDEPTLSEEIIDKILSAILDTVFSERQTVATKIDAIQMLVFLNNMSVFSKKIIKTYNVLKEKRDTIFIAYEDDFFSKHSIGMLKFNYQIMTTSFDGQNSNDLIDILSNNAQEASIEIIRSLECLEVLLDRIDHNQLEEKTELIITQFVMSFRYHQEINVRIHVVNTLFLLCALSFQDSILRVLSKMMDEENYMIKTRILRKLKLPFINNNGLIALIVEKGEADNHYLVKKAAHNIAIEKND